MVVNPSFPARTVPEFIAYAKENPAKINMASNGIGTRSHVAGELFKMMTGVNMVHVPYRGGASAIAALIAGQVQVMFTSPFGLIEYISDGKLRALAVTTVTRSEALPDVPPVGDFVPGYEVDLLVRDRRSDEHARRDCRQAQQGNQRSPCRSKNEGAHCRHGSHAVCQFAGGLRQVYRRRNREVGQRHQVRWPQGRLADYGLHCMMSVRIRGG